MKKSIFMSVAAIMLLGAGCSLRHERLSAPVFVHVGGFEIYQECLPGTRATPAGDYAKAITLAFFRQDGTAAYKHTQFKLDESTYTTFGEFATTLPIGSYTLVVLGYSSENPEAEVSLVSPTAAGFAGAVKETFAWTEQIVVSSTAPLNLSATLDRIIAVVRIVSSDGRTADAHSVRTIFGAGGKSFNPTTGLAIENSGFSIDFPITKAVGSTTSTGHALFLATDEQTMDITVQTLDEEGNVLCSTVATAVPLKRNRQTILTGRMYSAETAVGSFQLNTDWLPENQKAF